MLRRNDSLFAFWLHCSPQGFRLSRLVRILTKSAADFRTTPRFGSGEGKSGVICVRFSEPVPDSSVRVEA